MNLRDIENKLKNTIAQLEDAEKQLSDTHERIQLLKKQRVELEKFKKDYYDVLVAIHCFDEGVDVPQLEKIYIMASDRLIRQTVQRRGRVLRICKNSGKGKGYIYDFVVIPPNRYDEDTAARSLVKMEFSRVREYIRLADNQQNYIDYIKSLEEKFNLKWDEGKSEYERDEIDETDEEE